MRALTASLLAAAAGAAAASSAAPPRPAPVAQAEAKRRAVAVQIIALGSELRREIERGDASALAARIPPDGLRCAGRVVPKARVERDLRRDGTWLHGVLFGSPGAAAASGGGASLRDFLRRPGSVEIAVGFVPDARAGPVGRPCLHYRDAKGADAPGLPLCFENRGGTWMFTESLYPCG